MILYFTGTGNSRYIAELLGTELQDDVISINSHIKNGKNGDFVSSKPFVIVFPVYLSTAPAILRDFIRRSTFSGNRDAYFIATCASSNGATAHFCKDLCEDMDSLIFRGCAKVQMPQNYIPLFKMTEPEEQQRRFDAAKDTVKKIAELIENSVEIDGAVPSEFEYVMTKWVETIYNKMTFTKPFKVVGLCSGCGRCAKSCPTNTVDMYEGRPVWNKKTCLHCMACINNCPAKAIEYGRLTKGKERYVCRLKG